MSFLQIPIQTYPNTALGYQSSISTNTNAVQNTGFGFETLKSNSEGDRNSAFGHLSLTSVNGINAFGNGSGNSGFGYRTLFSLTTGNGNSAFGEDAMLSATTGDSNSAFGANALDTLTTGSGNAAFGAQALRSTNGSNSTAYGALAGQNSTGQTNSFFGYASGQDMTTGSENVIIGSFNGNNYGLDIRTLSNHIVLSDGLGVPRLWINNTGAVNIPGGIALTGSLSITGGTVTANNPVLSATQTWNNAAVTFTGWQLNVTDTASGANSLLMNLQVGGVTRFGVSKSGNGVLFGAGGVGAGNIAFGPMPTAENSVLLRGVGSGFNLEAFSNISVNINSGMPLGWATATYTTPDLQLWRDAANTLAQRNGVNAQTLRVYNTFTDASNYERAFFRWSGNTFQIGHESGGTGSGSRNLAFFTNSLERYSVDFLGNVVINTGAIPTNAANGFLYVPGCAGTPTGVPTAYTGRVPIVVDTTNNKLYFYSGGAWRDAGP